MGYQEIVERVQALESLAAISATPKELAPVPLATSVEDDAAEAHRQQDHDTVMQLLGELNTKLNNLTERITRLEQSSRGVKRGAGAQLVDPPQPTVTT